MRFGLWWKVFWIFVLIHFHWKIKIPRFTSISWRTPPSIKMNIHAPKHPYKNKTPSKRKCENHFSVKLFKNWNDWTSLLLLRFLLKLMTCIGFFTMNIWGFINSAQGSAHSGRLVRPGVGTAVVVTCGWAGSSPGTCRLAIVTWLLLSSAGQLVVTKVAWPGPALVLRLSTILNLLNFAKIKPKSCIMKKKFFWLHFWLKQFIIRFSISLFTLFNLKSKRCCRTSLI